MEHYTLFKRIKEYRVSKEELKVLQHTCAMGQTCEENSKTITYIYAVVQIDTIIKRR